jgi:hypothetical protein
LSCAGEARPPEIHQKETLLKHFKCTEPSLPYHIEKFVRKIGHKKVLMITG